MSVSSFILWLLGIVASAVVVIYGATGNTSIVTALGILLFFLMAYLSNKIVWEAKGQALEIEDLKKGTIYQNISCHKELVIDSREIYTLITDGKEKKLFKFKSSELPTTEFFTVKENADGKVFTVGISGESQQPQQ